MLTFIHTPAVTWEFQVRIEFKISLDSMTRKSLISVGSFPPIIAMLEIVQRTVKYLITIFWVNLIWFTIHLRMFVSIHSIFPRSFCQVQLNYIRTNPRNHKSSIIFWCTYCIFKYCEKVPMIFFTVDLIYAKSSFACGAKDSSPRVASSCKYANCVAHSKTETAS